ncbi:MAG: hypothetical protein ACKVVP_14605 [Chloroflexota bacterium]
MSDPPAIPLKPEFAALDRAFRRAVEEERQRSIETGTPFHVWQDGKLVDLNAPESRVAESIAPYVLDPLRSD